jgi:hypothetical protein
MTMTRADRSATRALATICAMGALGTGAALLAAAPDEIELSPGNWTIPGIFAALAIGLAVIGGRRLR